MFPMLKELALELIRGHAERHPLGLYFPRKRLVWSGYTYFFKLCDDDQYVEVGDNLITDEGAHYLLDGGLHQGSIVATFYVAPFSNNVAPTFGLTAATYHSTLNELNTEYSEANRPAYVEAAAANRITTNLASPAIITAASDGVTVWGAGLLASATKRSTTAPLLSARKSTAVFTLPTTGSTMSIVIQEKLNQVADT